MKYLLIGLLSALTLFGCRTQPTQPSTAPGHAGEAPSAAPLVTVYCDTYLIYEMCAVDVDESGSADALYFADNNEIFMYDAELLRDAYAGFNMHACVQVMDSEMKAASNRILTVTDDTAFLEKVSIKKGLMFNYARYFSKVRECRERVAASEPAEEAFGDPDNNDFF